METKSNTAQKSLWKSVPLHYWTGILGGAIWIIWLNFLLFLRANELRFPGEGFLAWLAFKMFYMPMDLSKGISTNLIIWAWAHDRANGGSLYLVPYYRASYIIPFFLFAIIGTFVGKLLNTPESKVRRRRLSILLAAVIVLWGCWICGLTFAYAMWTD
jgi:hypothetical protein